MQPEAPRSMAAVRWLVLLFLLLMAGVYGVLPFLPRRPWVWVYGIVLLGIGSASAFCLFTIPILVFYVRADVRAWYQESDRDLSHVT